MRIPNWPFSDIPQNWRKAMTDEQINEILAAAKVPEPPPGWENYDIQVGRAIEQAATLAERERCAKLCEHVAIMNARSRPGMPAGARECADAIREGRTYPSPGPERI
jgi:hypothetical protein